MNSTTSCSFYNPQEIGTSSSKTTQFASTTCSTSYGYSTSTNQSIYNGFTYGDVVISVFLFLLFSVSIYSFFYFKIKGFKVR